MNAQTKQHLLNELESLGYSGLAEDLQEMELTYDNCINYLYDNAYMLDNNEDFKAFAESKHELLKAYKFEHAKEDLLYNSGGNVMWSLFRTQSDRVAVYFHFEDTYRILPERSKYMDLQEIAENYNLEF